MKRLGISYVLVKRGDGKALRGAEGDVVALVAIAGYYMACTFEQAKYYVV